MDQAEQLRNIIKAGAIGHNKPLARVITVTSGKGGVGKSSVAINLAIQFRKLGQRVVILDADFGLANIEIMFGAVPKYNLSDLIYKGKTIRDIITWGPMEVGFISGGSGITGLSNLNKDYLTYIINNLSELDAIADIIIVDTAAGISDTVLEFLVASEEIVLITTTEPTSIADSYSLLKALNRHPKFSKEKTLVKIIANKVNAVKEGDALFEKLNAVVGSYLKIPITYLGGIPRDSQLPKAVMYQMPVSLKSPAAKSVAAFERITVSIMEPETDQIVPKRGVAAFFSRILSGKIV
ncbi:MinD/ParA family protein [Parablautia muri]|uniref:MinD/ParA family protein n=1 Tax=Parablautia muri TaxID=2320879 RepID=A0A9X5BGD1_9FIRM|nr:MinD/ParA family protein [Parablautia muri]NBJ93495.1 MinD/ParA family protein [Parablautia muri]